MARKRLPRVQRRIIDSHPELFQHPPRFLHTFLDIQPTPSKHKKIVNITDTNQTAIGGVQFFVEVTKDDVSRQRGKGASLCYSKFISGK
ncbi:hypothetical protein A0J57_23115 [Sphingobium sp. 22B]|nr:hypothetical protein AXW74_21460 [Sphingobium sp. AM]KYC29957.1 hypothetical protein A0J57_23115 [Sphingobium sp. 22B]OAP30018.1 hypothetical protein A8O16_20680 [Sphingobium sp. 20006FA]